ncbi:hypothetical protein OG21DRAFT_1506748, partial [Imleria badia]
LFARILDEPEFIYNIILSLVEKLRVLVGLMAGLVYTFYTVTERLVGNLVGLRSCFDGPVSPIGKVLDSKLHPGLIFQIPGRSSLSLTRH